LDDVLRSSWLAESCALRSDDSEARHRSGAQGTATEHLQAGSCRPATLQVINPAEVKQPIYFAVPEIDFGGFGLDHLARDAEMIA
jgi:hypothetical protein